MTPRALALATSLLALAPAARAGDPLQGCGTHSLPIVMEQVSNGSSWFEPNMAGMAAWNRVVEVFEWKPSDGSWGFNDENELAGFPSSSSLQSTWGAGWDDALATTLFWWFCKCCKIQESDVAFNPAYAWTTDPEQAEDEPAVYLYAPVLMHELGHVWGEQTNGESYDHDLPTVMHKYVKSVVPAGYTMHAPDAKLFRNLYDSKTSIPKLRDLAVFSTHPSGGSPANAVTDRAVVAPGETLGILGVTVENLGTKDLPDATIRFLLSADRTLDAGDVEIGAWTWSKFPKESWGVYDFTATLPDDAPLGAWWVLAAVTFGGSGKDGNAANDVTHLRHRITVAPPSGCLADAYEPNDSAATAPLLQTPLAPLPGLTICAGDEDWFRVWVQQGQGLAATASFAHALGDLDLELYDPSLQLVDVSTSLDDDEQVSIDAAPVGGAYHLRVRGAPNSYALAVALTGGVGAGAAPFVPGDLLVGAIDAVDDVALASFTGLQGMKVRLALTPTDGALKTRVTLLDPQGGTAKSWKLGKGGGKKQVKLKASGAHVLRIEGRGGQLGAFEVATGRKLPQHAQPFAKKAKSKQTTGAAVAKVGALPGAVLDVQLTPKGTLAGPLALALERPDGSLLDVAPYLAPGGDALADVPLDQAGKWRLVVTGFTGDAEKAKLVVTPEQPPEGSDTVDLE